MLKKYLNILNNFLINTHMFISVSIIFLLGILLYASCVCAMLFLDSHSFGNFLDLLLVTFLDLLLECLPCIILLSLVMSPLIIYDMKKNYHNKITFMHKVKNLFASKSELSTITKVDFELEKNDKEKELNF